MDATTERIVAETLRRRKLRLALQIVLGFGVPIALLSLWESAVWFEAIDRRFFPAPSQVAQSAVEILSEPGAVLMLAGHVQATLGRLLAGYLIGATAGISFGLFMGLYAPIRFGFAPLIFAVFPTPKLAIFPLLLVIFGIGDGSKIALVTLGVFFMTCINTLGGVLYANPIYRDVAQAFRLPTLTMWFRVVIPSALPAIITGLKLGLGQGLILVVASEFVAANDGVGQFIWDSWQLLDVPRMFLGLMVVATIGICAMLFGTFLERRFIPWANP